MLSFAFTPEQETFRAELTRYARTRLLPAYRERREQVSGIAVTEPGSGSDAAGMRTVAEPVPGGWRPSGEKIAITHAMCANTMLGWGSVAMDSVFVPADHLVGEEGRGFAAANEALWARQVDRPHTALAAMGKRWPPQVALDTIQAAMKIHGNLGYSTELPLQQRYRDVMAYLVTDGTSEIQKRIISKDMFRKVGA